MDEITMAVIHRNMPYLLFSLGAFLGTGICIIAAFLISHRNTHRHIIKHHLQDAAKTYIRDKDEEIKMLTGERDRLLIEKEELSVIVRSVHRSLGENLSGLYLVKSRRRSG